MQPHFWYQSWFESFITSCSSLLSQENLIRSTRFAVRIISAYKNTITLTLFDNHEEKGKYATYMQW